MHPLRAALAGLIDYAGLYPPASLDLAHVVANHQRYARSGEGWLLGRLVVPLARLEEVHPLIGRDDVSPESWTISVLARPGDRLDSLEDRITSFNQRHPGSAVVAVELAAHTVGDVSRIAGDVPERYERYIELALGDHLPELLDAVAVGGCYAKVRTGGVTSDAFPSAAALSAFIAHCVARDLPFKATAGLHHPIRGSYRLTYEPQSPSGVMHGFVNLVVATGLLSVRRIDDIGAASILETSDAAAFGMEGDGIRFGPHRLTIDECNSARAHVLRSVGSCSFEDAVADLRRIGWIGPED